jgi:flagellar FliL protein
MAMAEQKDKPEEGEETQPKSSKRKLLLVIALFVLILGSGGVALYMLGLIPGYKPGAAEEHDQEMAAEEQPAAPIIPLFAPLDPPFVVNLPPGDEVRLMQIGLTVLTYDPAVVEALKKHAPMLRNNLNLLFSAQTSAKLRTLEGKQELQTQILEEVRKVALMQIPTGSVEQVFFTGFVLQ